MISIPRLSAADALGDMVSALDRAGCLVVNGLADQPARRRVVAELASHLEAAPFNTDDDPAAFYPGLTQRVTALVARSGQVRELVLHPTVTAVCEHFLRPTAPDGYQLHVTAALNVGPGARAQVLHREEDPWLGGTLHGAGANVSDEWRYGVILTYSAAWLRQEENQYLDVPPDVAASLSSELQRMIGYKMNGALGFHDPSVRADSLSTTPA